MTKLQRKQEYYRQLTLAKKALKSKHFQMSFYHFENAHILGQKHMYRHTLSHYYMLIFGIKTKNSKEILGQISRIIASIFFTNIWAPTGNTGGSNISAIKPIPVRKELQKYF
ncbi:uncharacterized protein DUF3703 [Tenacibaculum gallaicum]|uniref:Uncharacterized protein DUF3703 n=1 Tax=Tenacibaculum gallaicum TaxID=561505 RepID=A0A3E0I7J7_9FLAO|nr:DUF3703 domain-containing protein [Tenacibaculum gallaicum]REH54607.1 uncharacterized protein DUF3703 [Tenacibaculum gallaicum]